MCCCSTTLALKRIEMEVVSTLSTVTPWVVSFKRVRLKLYWREALEITGRFTKLMMNSEHCTSFESDDSHRLISFCFAFSLNFPIQIPMGFALSFPIFAPLWCAYVPFHPIVFLCWTDTGHIDAMYMFIIAFHICVFECCSYLMSDPAKKWTKNEPERRHN